MSSQMSGFFKTRFNPLTSLGNPRVPELKGDIWRHELRSRAVRNPCSRQRIPAWFLATSHCPVNIVKRPQSVATGATTSSRFARLFKRRSFPRSSFADCRRFFMQGFTTAIAIRRVGRYKVQKPSCVSSSQRRHCDRSR